MRHEDLEHILRAAAQIANDPNVLVIGSQAILGGIPEDLLPREATASMEVDVAFFVDPDDTKAAMVDGAIGELSPFHETYGYYAQGVGVSTATLPTGWRDRLVVVESHSTAPGRGLCLEPHDCVLSKLVAGREKDYLFAAALIDARLVDPAVLLARCDDLDGPEPVLRRVREWIRAHTTTA